MKDAKVCETAGNGEARGGSRPDKFTVTPGETFRDARGTVRVANGFDMARVRRLYCIRNANEAPFRGWVAHKIEQKWFFPVSGITAVYLVKVDNFDQPSPTLGVDVVALGEESPAVLHVPGGYAIGVESQSPGAEVMVFSDCLMGELPDDVWRWPPGYWSRGRGAVGRRLSSAVARS